MSLEYSICPKSTVYVLRVRFMFQEHSLCPQSTVYVPRAQLCPHRNVYVPNVQSLTVYVPRIQFMYSLCPKSTVYVQEYSLENSLCTCLCPNLDSTVYVPVRFMS